MFKFIERLLNATSSGVDAADTFTKKMEQDIQAKDMKLVLEMERLALILQQKRNQL
jgi:hypothetical protein